MADLIEYRTAARGASCSASGCEGDPIQRGETYARFGGLNYHLECVIFARTMSGGGRP